MIAISNLNKQAIDISINILKERITLEFANYINTYSKNGKPLCVYINDDYIDIDEAIKKKTAINFNVIDEETATMHYFTGEIIHWKSKGVHERYFCTEEGTVLWSDRNTGISEKNFGHSLYIKSKLFADRYENNTHELLTGEALYDRIGEQARLKLANFFSKFLKENGKDFIQKLKTDKIYPYRELPENSIEEKEQEMYDILLYKVHTNSNKIFTGPLESKRAILELIKTGLEKDPKNMINVLQHLVHLDDGEVETLSTLLHKYSLASLIKISKAVTDKMSFIGELDHLIHSDLKKVTKERAHLHKILEQELWVFGDGYQEGTSDKGMKAVLEKHVKLLGREELITDYSGLSPNIPDLFLYKQFPQSSEGKLKHLVIELKKPGKKLTSVELGQIKKYALEVSNDDRFDKGNTEWEFVLISNEYNEEVEAEITQSNRPVGCAIDNPNYKVYVKTWGQILQGLKWKYSFLKQQLKNFDEMPENLDYIQEKMPSIVEDINSRK